MSQAVPPADEQDEDDVRYDLAGNPLPPVSSVRYDLAGNPLPSAAPPPAQAGSGSPAPSFGTAQPAFTPPPTTAPRPGLPPTSLPSASGGGGWTPPPGSAPPPGGGMAWGGTAAPTRGLDGGRLYGGIAAAAALLLVLIFALKVAKPATIAAPTSYAPYTALDNTFTCDGPTDWKMKETGVTGGNEATVTFEKGNAKVRIISDAAGSMMGDAMGGSAPPPGANEQTPGEAALPPPKPAVEKLHEMDKHQLADSVDGYQEGEMQTPTLAAPARLSEWTGEGGMGKGKLHGYRVTMLGRDREYTIICLSPERNWAILKPAFDRILASLKPGGG